jgi:DNA polymerase V
MIVMAEHTIKFLGCVQAGFPSPAGDYSEDDIDLAKLLSPKSSVYCFRAVNDSMIGAYIPEGSILVVDKALTPKNYSIVIGVVNGEFTVKHYVKKINSINLLPANPKYKPIEITEGMQFEVWGVVTAVVIMTK